MHSYFWTSFFCYKTLLYCFSFSLCRQAAVQARKESPHRVIEIDATKASLLLFNFITAASFEQVIHLEVPRGVLENTCTFHSTLFVFLIIHMEKILHCDWLRDMQVEEKRVNKPSILIGQ